MRPIISMLLHGPWQTNIIEGSWSITRIHVDILYKGKPSLPQFLHIDFVIYIPNVHVCVYVLYYLVTTCVHCYDVYNYVYVCVCVCVPHEGLQWTYPCDNCFVCSSGSGKTWTLLMLLPIAMGTFDVGLTHMTSSLPLNRTYKVVTTM